MVLAARAIVREAENITLDDNGTAHRGALNKRLPASELEKDVRIVNTGQGCGPGRGRRHRLAGCRRTRSAERPDHQPRLLHHDRRTRRSVATVAQNTRLVVVLTVAAQGSESLNGNFLLVDALPAGFEIENPTLISSGSTAGLPWLSDLSYVPYTEFRDDRFVAAFNTSSATCPTWCGRWRRAATCIRAPSSRTCTGRRSMRAPPPEA